jgi:sulfur carrier protein ThiS
VERVKVQIWMWQGKELGPEWVTPGDLRANMETEVVEGTTVRVLLDNLAERYVPIREKVFPDHQFSTQVVVTLNHQGVSKEEILGSILRDGDVITVVPLIVGG